MKTIIEYLTGLEDDVYNNPSITIYSDGSGIITRGDDLNKIIFSNKYELFKIINDIKEPEIKL